VHAITGSSNIEVQSTNFMKEISMDQATDDQPGHAALAATMAPTHAIARTEAERVLDEIEQAAGLAEASLANDATLGAAGAAPVAVTTTSAETPVLVGDESALSPEEVERAKAEAREARIAYFMKRAKSQKERGRAQLERVHVGAMAIRKDVEFFDVNISSSAERFLGLIDLAFYTINRRGEDVLGEKGAADVIERLTELARGYREKGVAERDQAHALLKNEQELAFDTDWIVPEYRGNAFQMAVFIKHPETLKILEGLFAFDTLVRHLTVLQWNGKVDQVRIDQARQQERRALSALHQFAARSLIGLNRRARPARPGMASRSTAVQQSAAADPALAH
jgi:hypothetical protein